MSVNATTIAFFSFLSSLVRMSSGFFYYSKVLKEKIVENLCVLDTALLHRDLFSAGADSLLSLCTIVQSYVQGNCSTAKKMKTLAKCMSIYTP